MYLILIAVLLRSLVSVFAKKAALTSVGLGLYGMVVNIWFIAELVTLAAQALVWIIVLRRTALSVAYPVLSLVIAVNVLSAWLIFNETILLQHILGVVIIIAGIVILNPAKNG